ncbi:MAG: HAMP domain-containing histidine kinase [Lachnospiraceae bacterium]|nr:HAMP domain-containing histidine kinase [Lachnospiraceae bacterium]
MKRKNRYIENINKFFNPEFKERKFRTSLTVMFALAAFAVFLAGVAIVAILAVILVNTGVMSTGKEGSTNITLVDGNKLLTIMLLTSLVTGAAWAFIFGRLFMKPINQLVNMMNRLASGDFSVRIPAKNRFSHFPVVKEMTDSFNTMASELDKTEILRSDFINNFSHEFKTPIVSIAGFAKLLKEGNLSEEEKREYINVIEEESLRLSEMATKVLELTRIENQTILSDIAEYNLSEQLRTCFLLLENKWESKEIDFSLDFREYNIKANENLLKEVWLNIIDNAIKFTTVGGSVKIEIEDEDPYIAVKITNSGSFITDEDKKKIFSKFYQADASHSMQGNGIGLAVCKRIVELHHGRIRVKSGEEGTTFITEIPKKQSYGE